MVTWQRLEIQIDQSIELFSSRVPSFFNDDVEKLSIYLIVEMVSNLATYSPNRDSFFDVFDELFQHRFRQVNEAFITCLLKTMIRTQHFKMSLYVFLLLLEFTKFSLHMIFNLVSKSWVDCFWVLVEERKCLDFPKALINIAWFFHRILWNCH